MSQIINLIVGDVKFYLITPEDVHGNAAPITPGSLKLELGGAPNVIKIEQNPANEFHYRVDAESVGEADLKVIVVNTMGAEIFTDVKYAVSDGAGIATGIKVSETTAF